MTPNNTIMYNIQAVFNLLPNLNVDNLAKAFVEHSNDVHLVIYISSIVRALGCWSLLGCREVYWFVVVVVAAVVASLLGAIDCRVALFGA